MANSNERPIIAAVRDLMREHNDFGMNQLTPEMVVALFEEKGWVEPTPVYVIPTEDGHYLDKDGDHWQLPQEGPLDPINAPYIRLVPEQ